MPVAMSPALRNLASRWTLNGTTAASTLDGRLWARVELDNGEFSISLYRRDGMDPGDVVASATGAGPTLALTESNDSGVTGAAELARDAAQQLSATGGTLTGIIQMPPAVDADLEALEPDLGALLDEGGTYAGAAGFSIPLLGAGDFLNGALRRRLLNRGWCESDACEALAALDAPRLLRDATAHLALARIFQRESGRGDPKAGARAAYHRQQARESMAALRLTFHHPGGVRTRINLGSPGISAW